MEFNNPVLESKFNAGVDVALEISKYVKLCALYSSRADYYNWFITLETIERRISPKIRKKEESLLAINKIKQNYSEDMRRYLLRVTKGKIISFTLSSRIKQFLQEYEMELLHWRDTFGYGMPSKDDASSAAFR